MNEVSFEINSNEEIWDLFDKDLNNIFIHQFNPKESISWWQTDLKIGNGNVFKDLSVRGMTLDIQTDLTGLKKILELNSNHLRIYQFEKPLPDTLVLEYLPEKSRNLILKQNGLKHFFFIDFEFLTVGSFDNEFIKAIETSPKYQERTLSRKRN